MLKALPILAALLAATSAPGAQAAASWRASWAASPAMPMTANPTLPAAFATPKIAEQTIVQVVRLSAGGARLRLRLTNEYGAQPLAIGHARVALLGADGVVTPGSEREVTFGGGRTAIVPAHAPLLSDAVPLKTPSLAALQVSIYVAGTPANCTCHATGLQEATLSPPGDFTAQPFTPAGKTENRAFLSAVEVEGDGRTTPRPTAIVAFGDSITDGYKSTSGANRRWPDRLAERLVAAGSPTPVANAGIGGNRVLSDGVIPLFGESALTRFDRDVLGLPGVTHIVVLEGVNDMGAKAPPSAEELIAGYRQLILRGHAHRVKVIFATVLPYKGAAYFRPDGEAVRAAVNAWIRTNKEADGVIDFDKAVRDPADPQKMQAALQSGDWLHPNDAGYRAMGDAVDLRLFRQR